MGKDSQQICWLSLLHHGAQVEVDKSRYDFELFLFLLGIHSSKKGKMAAQRAQRDGKGFGWQKKKSMEKAKKFKKWQSVSDSRQFSR